MEKKIYDPSLAENRYRHEFKYLCSYGELMTLKVRLQGLVSLDTHVGESGVYNIRSLYFDDIYDTATGKMKQVPIQGKNSGSGSTTTAANGSVWS